MKYAALIFVCLLLSMATAPDLFAEKVTVQAQVGPDGIQRVDVVGGEYFFKPDRIIVKVNVPVEMKIRKEKGLVPHDFVIEAREAGIEVKEAMENDPKTVRFTPKKTGTYPFICSKKLLFFKSHKEKGMEGILEVVD